MTETSDDVVPSWHRLAWMVALAITRIELGEFDRAEAVLTRVEQFSPGAPQVSRLRERLEQKREEAR